MKRTFVTTLPDHIGAFLEASRILSKLNINITRVSYNKAIDSNTLFMEAEGTQEQLCQAEKTLAKVGYLTEPEQTPHIVLMEFQLKDEPGSVEKILELIKEENFNISYMSSQANDTPYQYFKIGLFAQDPTMVDAFLIKAKAICPVQLIHYNRSEKIFDNSIFYQAFVDSLMERGGIASDQKKALLIHTNLAMQLLDEKGLSPYRTFDSISRFADLLANAQGDGFAPRISRHSVSEKTEVILIEPPCGSNVAILKSGEDYLFIDSGYAYYHTEMFKVLRSLIPTFDEMKKRILITHADVDHCGLLPWFDEIYASEKTAQSLRLDYDGEDDFREENLLHKPYIRICKILTRYAPPQPQAILPLGNASLSADVPKDEVLWQIGYFSFGDLRFEVYEGRGGHLKGETVLIDYRHHVAFTGDIYINLKDLTPEQKQYNQYAPILMTSVDSDPALCALERRAILQRLGSGVWQIFGGHGYKKELDMQASQ